MLSESLRDPNFRKEWEDANRELAGLDERIAMMRNLNGRDALEAGLRKTKTPERNHHAARANASLRRTDSDVRASSASLKP